LQLLEQVLVDAGHEVSTESDSAAILERLRQESPDLMVLDLFIGDLNGFDLIAEVRADPQLGSMPLLLCTGATRDVDARHDWLLEMKVPVLEKPFDLDDLVQQVATLVGGGPD